MPQLCEPAVRVRRLSSEEFCRLAMREAGSLYRPRSEVMRMLTAGQVLGICSERAVPEIALLELPMTADTALAAAMRALVGWQGVLLTPPVGRRGESLAPLLTAALEHAARRTSGGVWAVLEATPDAEELLPLYLENGLVLRAACPLNSLAPCWLFAAAPPAERPAPVWVRLADRPRLAMLLGRGWAAVASRPGRDGPVLALYPV